ncbi:hypothetical protein [Mixta calida]|uniref:hypothetical protein n=1 Tax=Mixta calida TaxID=665913 RepID=UPI000EEFB68A|nr:hypothetical protein [Mixta calida]MDU4290761.1 hypothetical protein [Mixta calida]HCW48384.1 hypothetical protein [Erwiniaceae bacterium]
MRELNGKEVAIASGGIFWFETIGSTIGREIGKIVDEALNIDGSGAGAGSKIGGGIGKVLSLNIVGGIEQIGQGISEIVKMVRNR